MVSHKKRSSLGRSILREVKSDVSGVAHFGKSVALAPVNAFTKVATGTSGEILIPLLIVGGLVVGYYVYTSRR
jgi:hypothetical protein